MTANTFDLAAYADSLREAVAVDIARRFPPAPAGGPCVPMTVGGTPYRFDPAGGPTARDLDRWRMWLDEADLADQLARLPRPAPASALTAA